MGYSPTDLVMISILGLLIVFVVLVVLSLLTTLIGKIIPSLEGRNRAAVSKNAPIHETVSAPSHEAEDETGELIALLQCVLSRESGIAADEMIITSIESAE